IETKRPTTTGGSPMPVLMKLTTSARAGNRVRAISVPSGIPMASARPVDVAAIWNDSQVIARTSRSIPRRRRNARCIPSQMSSMLRSTPDLLFGLPGDGHEESLPVLLDAEGLDRGLSARRHHEVRERLAARDVHPRAVRRVHFHHRVDVEEWPILLDEDR